MGLNKKRNCIGLKTQSAAIEITKEEIRKMGENASVQKMIGKKET